MQGLIFDIKRFAVHDGPGIRTTVFLKGCTLNCIWCHNPESRSKEITHSDKQVKISEKVYHKQEQIGKFYTSEELLKEILKDVLIMEESAGGVTFSGGEPLMQIDFLAKILRLTKENNIHTAVDTTAYVNPDTLNQIVSYTDLFLLDLKHYDSSEHRKYTGVFLEQILENIQFLYEINKKLWIRIPIIPNINFSENHTKKFVQLLNKFSRKPELVCLLPYHNTAKKKYKNIGAKNIMKSVKSLKKEELIPIKTIFEEAGYKVKIGG